MDPEFGTNALKHRQGTTTVDNDLTPAVRKLESWVSNPIRATGQGPAGWEREARLDLLDLYGLELKPDDGTHRTVVCLCCKLPRRTYFAKVCPCIHGLHSRPSLRRFDKAR